MFCGNFDEKQRIPIRTENQNERTRYFIRLKVPFDINAIIRILNFCSNRINATHRIYLRINVADRGMTGVSIFRAAYIKTVPRALYVDT